MKATDFIQARERFLPISATVLLEHMLADPRLLEEERHRLCFLFEMIGARFHFEFHYQLQQLKKDYEPFDPDLETVGNAALSTERIESRRTALIKAYRHLLEEANYVEIPREQIIECLELQTHGGLSVRASLADYRELFVFYRGAREEEISSSWNYRHWLPGFIRKRFFPPRKAVVFRRAALLVHPADKEKDRNFIYLKLFKNVIVSDVKMILPRVHIRMKWLDQLKIGSSVAGGAVATLGKLFTTAVVLSPALFLAVVGGLLGAAFKGVMSFLGSRTRYMQTLSSHLYFQNLANNSSALTLLTDTAEAEELKEMLLAYFILYVERDCDYTKESLDTRIEHWLRDEFNVNIDFEVSDALRKLVEKGLIVDQGEPRHILKVYDLPSALRRLDKAWDEFFKFNGYIAPEKDRLADATWPLCPLERNTSS